MLKVNDVLKDGKFLGDRVVLDEPYRGVSIDSRKASMGNIFIAIKGKRFDGHDFVDEAIGKGAIVAVVERELAGRNIFLVESSIKALHGIAKAVLDYIRPFKIGITGTCGKTTVKEMTYKALSSFRKVERTRGNENNLIGLPLNVANLSSCEVFIAEMGTNTPGEISTLSRLIEPDLAIITSIGEGHLEGLGSLAGVFREKIGILDGMKSGGLLIFPGDSPFFTDAVSIAKARGIEVLPFYSKEVNEIKPGVYRFSIGGRELEGSFCYVGEHMGINSLIVLKVAGVFGIDPESIIEALKGFEPVGSRFNLIHIKGVTVIDDTYNANPLSTRYALITTSKFEGKKIFVFGSMMELGEYSVDLHREIGRVARSANIDLMFTLGEFASYALHEFVSLGGKGSHFDTHDDLVKAILSEIREGDVILVKGSRAMRMEIIVEELVRCYGS
jgi:UDP-N-acetylmuramoyl-tripeptide--D-alanyl-D-alanine ligase